MKHIKMFEEYSTGKEIREETSGTWSDVRDTIQSLKPFTIINFKNTADYSRFIEDFSDNYIKQTYYSFWNGKENVFPSIFINKKVKLNKEDFKKYKMFNILSGEKDSDSISLTSEDGKESAVANEIVDTLSPSEMYGEDYYKLGSVFYKFINFLS